jgi:cell division protein ZapD
VPRADPIDHHFALVTLFEIVEVAGRADLKSDVLKDLERHKAQLAGYRDNPSIAQDVLEEVIAQLDASFTALHEQPGKAGQSLTENDWLMSLRSRVSIPGGTCGFDLPAYYAWQHKDADTRRRDIGKWTSTLAPLAEAIAHLLRMLRDSGAPQKVIALAGQFQQNLPQGRTYHLLRLRIDPASGLIPEISGNRLMVSVRLMHHGEDDKLHQSAQDAAFELALCA